MSSGAVHVLFVHKTFPGQFGHLAAHLVNDRGWRCTFVSDTEAGNVGGIERIQCSLSGGATELTHFCSRTFENAVWQGAAVYDALVPVRDELRPDLIVGHSGLGPTLFLRELFPATPVLGYFEYFYADYGGDIDFLPDRRPSEFERARARARNAMVLLDLEYCRAGYTPTRFQYGLFPEAYRHKLTVLHDGVDLEFWRRREVPDRSVGGFRSPEGSRVVTYCARGLESVRGFDVFMRIAKRICDRRDDVVFLVVGEDRVAYGSDLAYTGGASFKQHVLSQDEYDLDRIRFLGRVPPDELARVFSVSDLHVYLTVPFVLSWSLLDAMACGCTVLVSGTEPVREVVRHGENGLVRDFFDVEGFVDDALSVLDDPEGHRERLGATARSTIARDYDSRATFPRIAALFEATAAIR